MILELFLSQTLELVVWKCLFFELTLSKPEDRGHDVLALADQSP